MYARNAITNAVINLEFLFLWTVVKGASYSLFFLIQPRNSSREDSNLACWPIRNLEFLHKPCDANKTVILCVKTVWWVFARLMKARSGSAYVWNTWSTMCTRFWFPVQSHGTYGQTVCVWSERPSHFLTIRVNFHNHASQRLNWCALLQWVYVSFFCLFF